MISDFEIKDGILIQCLNKDIIVADIPDEVIVIGDCAFYDCDNLETVNAQKLTRIGDGAFRSCNSLKTINAQKLTRIGDSAFCDCEDLQTVNADEVIEIGAWAFYHCHNLETVNAPKLTTIGAHAFRSCNSLKIINAPKLTKIDVGVFDGCSKLISQPGNYKALCKDLTSKEGNFQYELGVKTPYIKDIKLCNVGYHYVTNIYDIFNYYWGEINEDFVITVTTPEDTSEEKSYDSKKVCHSITDDRILTLKEIRILLNGGEIE